MLWGIYLLEYLFRGLINIIKPGVYSLHTPPGAIADYILIPLALIMFSLAVYSRYQANKQIKYD